MYHVSEADGFRLSFFSSFRSSTLGGPSMQIWLESFLTPSFRQHSGKLGGGDSSGNFPGGCRAFPGAAETAVSPRVISSSVAICPVSFDSGGVGAEKPDFSPKIYVSIQQYEFYFI